jgi:RNA polymerase sigma-70 factor (ECF subfamily)
MDSLVSLNIKLERQERMRSLLDDHQHIVVRTLRRAGVPHAELDDEVQRTFIVAAGRLQEVRPGAERSFLRQVALNRAFHVRRSLARRRESPMDKPPERSESAGTPEDLTGRRQIRDLLAAAVADLDERMRSVFVLYTLEEMGMPEIARVLRLPRGTVASRLRRARAQIRHSLPIIQLACELGVDARDPRDEPVLLRREDVSRLARALLRIGTTKRASDSLRARTLAACGARARV